jgi:hypothetical protein
MTFDRNILKKTINLIPSSLYKAECLNKSERFFISPRDKSIPHFRPNLMIRAVKMKPFPSSYIEAGSRRGILSTRSATSPTISANGESPTPQMPHHAQRMFRRYPQRDYSRHQSNLDHIFTRIFP